MKRGKSNSFLRLVQGHLPLDVATGAAERFGYGAVLVHGKFNGALGLIGINGAFQVEMDIRFDPDGGFFTLFSFRFDGHFNILQVLALFLEDIHHINAGAAAEPHQQHLHGADAEVFATGFGAGIHFRYMAHAIGRFKSKFTGNPVDLNFYHKITFFTKVIVVCTYFAR